MGNDWKRVKISDVCELIVDCINKTAPKVEYPTKYKMLRTPNIKNGRVDTNGCNYVNEETFVKWTRRSEVRRNDVLLTREAPLGEVGIVKSDEKLFLGQRLMQYRADLNQLDPDFLNYSFLSHDLQHQFRMHEGSGSVVSHIRVGDCSKFELNLPPLSLQRKIAYILSIFDSKIELNRQINQTLEQMAQALFKSWFVDFDPVIDNALAAGNPIPEALQHRVKMRQEIRNKTTSQEKNGTSYFHTLFPSEFEQTGEPTVGIAGWIPKGWERVTFNSLVKLVGGGTPKTSIEEYWCGDIPWFSVVDAPSDSDVFVIDTEKHVTEYGVDHSSTKILRIGTTIISARGTVGKCALVGKPMAMNQSCYGLNGVKGITDTFIYFLTKLQVSDLRKRGHGSVFNTITRETFKSINLAFSGSELTKEFECLVKPYLAKILLNNEQVTELTKTRNTLLPKLISGEITLDQDITAKPETTT